MIEAFCGDQHCEKYPSFTKFPRVEILGKAQFPQSFGRIEVGKITVFFAVQRLEQGWINALQTQVFICCKLSSNRLLIKKKHI